MIVGKTQHIEAKLLQVGKDGGVGHGIAATGEGRRIALVVVDCCFKISETSIMTGYQVLDFGKATVSFSGQAFGNKEVADTNNTDFRHIIPLFPFTGLFFVIVNCEL